MDGVNKTLYIPLYGKALVSRKGILLRDTKAEEIWEKEGFALQGKAASKWLAYRMAMRGKVFDDWTAWQLEKAPDALVLHLGCGLDSRCQRLPFRGRCWYDLDFPQVIQERRKYFAESGIYRMVPGDLRLGAWKEAVPAGGTAIVVMEGVSMYLRPRELEQLLGDLRGHFARVSVLMDCYSTFAAWASKYRNPISEVGVTTVYGMDNADAMAEQTGFSSVQELDLAPTRLIRELSAVERVVFSNLYAGKLARKIYRLYEFEG